jgi:putative acetyltransferase
MELRTPQLVEEPEIHTLVSEAFGDEGPLICELVSEMLIEPRCRLWVADNSGLQGIIGISEARLESRPKEAIWILAPLAVKTSSQGKGVGGSLVSHCLQELCNEGATGVFVYGDPDYYGRFSFDQESASQVSAPFPLEYPMGWQAFWWKTVDIPAPESLTVNGPLNKPDLW